MNSQMKEIKILQTSEKSNAENFVPLKMGLKKIAHPCFPLPPWLKLFMKTNGIKLVQATYFYN